MTPILWPHSIARREEGLVALAPSLRLECMVRRIEPGRAMGVAFVVPHEARRAQLAALLRVLAKK